MDNRRPVLMSATLNNNMKDSLQNNNHVKLGIYIYIVSRNTFEPKQRAKEKGSHFQNKTSQEFFS